MLEHQVHELYASETLVYRRHQIAKARKLQILRQSVNDQFTNHDLPRDLKGRKSDSKDEYT